MSEPMTFWKWCQVSGTETDVSNCAAEGNGYGEYRAKVERERCAGIADRMAMETQHQLRLGGAVTITTCEDIAKKIRDGEG